MEKKEEEENRISRVSITEIRGEKGKERYRARKPRTVIIYYENTSCLTNLYNLSSRSVSL